MITQGYHSYESAIAAKPDAEFSEVPSEASFYHSYESAIAEFSEVPSEASFVPPELRAELGHDGDHACSVRTYNVRIGTITMESTIHFRTYDEAVACYDKHLTEFISSGIVNDVGGATVLKDGCFLEFILPNGDSWIIK